MREIKFRVWDVDEEEWYNNEKIPYQLIDNEGVFYWADYYGWDPYPGEVLIMQYTGLKDKNGTEIYEGDVVKGTAIQIEGGFDYFGEVEFITQNTAYGLQVTEPMRNGVAGGWSIDQLRTRISLDHITGEVIGNIHEHPHLLSGD